MEVFVQVRKNNDVWVTYFVPASDGLNSERRSWRKWLWPPGEPWVGPTMTAQEEADVALVRTCEGCNAAMPDGGVRQAYVRFRRHFCAACYEQARHGHFH